MRSTLLRVGWMALVSLPLVAQTAGAAGQGGDQGAVVKKPADSAPEGSGAQKSAKKKANRPPKVTTSPGSGETHAERTARLRRECKGMPNAGACTGMTH